MKKNEVGFSAPHILIVVLVIGLVGVAGWYVWSQNSNNHSYKTQSKSDSQEQSEATQEVAHTPNFETADWYKYESTNKAYTIRLADGLSFTTYKIRNVEDLGIYTNDDLANMATTKATVDESKQEDANFFGDGLSFDIIFNGSGGPIPEGDNFTTFKTEQGKTVMGYKFVQDGTSVNTNIPKGATEYTYFINGNIDAGENETVAYFSATYIVAANKEGNLPLAESMLKTVYIAN